MDDREVYEIYSNDDLIIVSFIRLQLQFLHERLHRVSNRSIHSLMDQR